jgi:hypothetical protein
MEAVLRGHSVSSLDGKRRLTPIEAWRRFLSNPDLWRSAWAVVALILFLVLFYSLVGPSSKIPTSDMVEEEEYAISWIDLVLTGHSAILLCLLFPVAITLAGHGRGWKSAKGLTLMVRFSIAGTLLLAILWLFQAFAGWGDAERIRLPALFFADVILGLAIGSLFLKSMLAKAARREGVIPTGFLEDNLIAVFPFLTILLILILFWREP